MAHEAGKGDKRRPEDTEAYRNNFDAIFRKQYKAMAEVQALERERMSGKNTTQESVDKQEKQ